MYPCHVDWTCIFQKKKRQLMKHPQENYCEWITSYSIFYLQLLRNQIIVLQLGSSADQRFENVPFSSLAPLCTKLTHNPFYICLNSCVHVEREDKGSFWLMFEMCCISFIGNLALLKPGTGFSGQHSDMPLVLLLKALSSCSFHHSSITTV